MIIACQVAIQHSNAGGWVLLAIWIIIITTEIILVKKHKWNISQWVRFKFKGKGKIWLILWRVFGMSVIGITLWHLFFGGPI